MASSRDRTSSAKPLMAVPSPDASEAAGEQGHRPVGSPEHSRRLYDLTERVLELEVRLRERVESERVLDAEVRSLQRDAELRQAYLSDLEGRHHELLAKYTAKCETFHELAWASELERAELEWTRERAQAEAAHCRALESRAVVRLADALARKAAQHPGSVRFGSWAARRVARRLP